MKITKIEIEIKNHDDSISTPEMEITLEIDGRWWFLSDFLNHLEARNEAQ